MPLGFKTVLALRNFTSRKLKLKEIKTGKKYTWSTFSKPTRPFLGNDGSIEQIFAAQE